eukprot:m.53268 g.53268  ORF g.53268 m.53268 type:complete len:325 (+) comp15441_c0_seq2:655-1629(+)
MGNVHGLEIEVPFFIYPGPTFNPDYCYNDDEVEVPQAGYPCITRTFIEQAEKHPWRVLDPEQAKIFVVPFDVAASHLDRCGGGKHGERIANVLKALQGSKFYQRHGGKDHVWTIPDYRLPMMLDGRWGGMFPSINDNQVIKNMSIGRYLQYYHSFKDRTHIGYEPHSSEWPYELENWRCTVKVPVMSPRSLWLADRPAVQEDGTPDHTLFHNWQKRNIFLFFRGRGHCNNGDATANRMKAVEVGENKAGLVWPGKIIMTDGHADTQQAYYDEMLDAKYCLVRCPRANRNPSCGRHEAKASVCITGKSPNSEKSAGQEAALKSTT